MGDASYVSLIFFSLVIYSQVKENDQVQESSLINRHTKEKRYNLSQKILIIQTAFIGDVVLATPLIEVLHQRYPKARIDFLLRKGNEGLLKGHPILNKVIVWNKKEEKYTNLKIILQNIRAEKYNQVVNVQRFFTTGLLTALSGAKIKIGFDKNPLSAFFTKKIKHEIGVEGQLSHEVERNLSLISRGQERRLVMPKLYPSTSDFEKVKTEQKYICIAPTSVWFTKQFPAEKWIELIDLLPQDHQIFLLGGPVDKEACEAILQKSNHPNVINKAGAFSLLESVAMMKNAKMNYVNDSAPLHFASAVNAPVTAVFLSTVPQFGFTPLSDQSKIFEPLEKLDCRPCNLHGHKACPKGHFKCSEIDVWRLSKVID